MRLGTLHRRPASVCTRVQPNRVCVHRPEWIERNRRVRRAGRAEVICLRPTVTRSPACLRIATARKYRALQRQCHTIRLGGCLL